MGPYIGVTGFTKPQEVLAALEAFPQNSNRKLMVGVLASWKSLRGIPMKPARAKRTPNFTTIGSIFPDDERVVNLVHVNSEEGQENSLLDDMLQIHDLAGPNLHGFQLNIPWPAVRTLYYYRMKMGFGPRIVLQIGQKAIQSVDGTPRAVADMLTYYVEFIDDVLIDRSGGLGMALDTNRARAFLTAIAEKPWRVGIGVAGGLGPDTLHLVEPLIRDFPDLSIDAEGRLRDAENSLDPEPVKTYLTNALQIFSRK